MDFCRLLNGLLTQVFFTTSLMEAVQYGEYPINNAIGFGNLEVLKAACQHPDAFRFGDPFGKILKLGESDDIDKLLNVIEEFKVMAKAGMPVSGWMVYRFSEQFSARFNPETRPEYDQKIASVYDALIEADQKNNSLQITSDTYPKYALYNVLDRLRTSERNAVIAAAISRLMTYLEEKSPLPRDKRALKR